MPPEDPPPIATPIAKINPIIPIPEELPETSTPGGRYKKGNAQPLVRDLISFMFGSFSIGLPRKLLVIIQLFRKILFLNYHFALI